MFKNKKIILYFSFAVIIAVAVTFIGDNPRYLLIPTSSIPVAEHIIVLDAGHGIPDRSVLLVKMAFLKNK